MRHSTLWLPFSPFRLRLVAGGAEFAGHRGNSSSRQSYVQRMLYGMSRCTGVEGLNRAVASAGLPLDEEL